MDDATSFNSADHAAEILAAITDASDDAIIVTSLEGVIQTWNRGAERLYGYTADDMTGRSIAALIPSGHADDLTTVLDRIRTGTRVVDNEAVRQARDGRHVDVALTMLPIHAAGAVVGATIIARDLGAQKRAERGRQTSEMRWRAVIASAVDGIVVIDAHGRIEAFNPAAERLFGYKEREVLGRNVTVLMPAPYRDEHDGYLRRYLDTGAAKIIGIGREVTGLRRDGTVFPLHLSVGEMSVGGDRKFIGILHDLTDRVRMEEKFREHAAMAHLGEMAAVIAHEVRNPLAGIRGAVQVIASHLPRDSRDVIVTDEIVKRIDGLNDLIKDLLLFAREAGARERRRARVRDGRPARAGSGRAARPRRSKRRGAADHGGCGTAQDRVRQRADERRARDGRRGSDSGVGRGRRGDVPHRVPRSRSRHSGVHPREDLHAVLHDEVERHRARPADDQASDRRARRANRDRVPVGRRHDRHRRASRLTSSRTATELRPGTDRRPASNASGSSPRTKVS
jgi:PAS domain S-box-containing protein